MSLQSLDLLERILMLVYCWFNALVPERCGGILIVFMPSRRDDEFERAPGVAVRRCTLERRVFGSCGLLCFILAGWWHGFRHLVVTCRLLRFGVRNLPLSVGASGCQVEFGLHAEAGAVRLLHRTCLGRWLRRQLHRRLLLGRGPFGRIIGRRRRRW